jgi:hypothetical protein
VRAALAVALALAADPASAACHHYSKWLYPFPQPRCGITARTTDPSDHSWYVEITKLPDDLERAAAIQKLREEMERK